MYPTADSNHVLLHMDGQEAFRDFLFLGDSGWVPI